MKAHLHISAIILALSVAGCGGWSVDKARRALDLSARAVNVADASVAVGYRALNDKLEARIDQGDITLEEFDGQRAPWQTAVRAVQSSGLTAVTILLKTIGELIDVVEGHLGGEGIPTRRVEDLLSDTSKAKLEDLRGDALRRRLEERSD